MENLKAEKIADPTRGIFELAEEPEFGKLGDEQLDKVTGGLHLTKSIDVSSPNLFLACASGKHLR